jgi:hypothetical protein
MNIFYKVETNNNYKHKSRKKEYAKCKELEKIVKKEAPKTKVFDLGKAKEKVYSVSNTVEKPKESFNKLDAFVEPEIEIYQGKQEETYKKSVKKTIAEKFDLIEPVETKVETYQKKQVVKPIEPVKYEPDKLITVNIKNSKKSMIYHVKQELSELKKKVDKKTKVEINKELRELNKPFNKIYRGIVQGNFSDLQEYFIGHFFSDHENSDSDESILLGDSRYISGLNFGFTYSKVVGTCVKTSLYLTEEGVDAVKICLKRQLSKKDREKYRKN